jgi:hypothetical protein
MFADIFWYESFSWFWCKGTRCLSLSKYFRYALYNLLKKGFRIEYLCRFFLGSGPSSSMCVSILWLFQLGNIFLHDATAPSGPGPPHYRGFTITLRHTTLGRNSLDEWSAPRRYRYLTTHNTQTRQTSMQGAAFEPAIPVSERPQTHV